MTSSTSSPSTASTDPQAVPIANRPLTLWAIIQVLVLAAGWGGNAPALRFSLAYLPAYSAAGIRFAVGLAVILLFAAVQRIPLRAERKDWAPLAWMGLLFTVQIALLNYGSAHTGASRQALLINSYPLFVPLLAHVFLPGDRLTPAKLGGTGLAFLGVLAMFGEKFGAGRADVLGDLLILASAVLLAGKAIYTSVLVRTLHPYVILVWHMVFAVPCFFVLSLLTEPQQYHWSGSVAFSVLYQGIIVAGLCFVLWTVLLQQYSPSRLSVGFFLTPAFGAVLSHLFLGEPITRGLLIGGGAILLGLLLVNRPSGRRLTTPIVD